jgi:hypothetical protein
VFISALTLYPWTTLGGGLSELRDLVSGMRQSSAGDILVVRLIVLVPFVASVNAVDIPRLSWSISVFPGICRWMSESRFGVEEFLFIVLV